MIAWWWYNIPKSPMQATHFYIKLDIQILVFFVCFLCIYSDWVCHRQCVMFSLSAWLTISWWRARLASLWRGTGALESTSKWPKHTKEGLVVCVETIMMTDRMISAAAAVRQSGPDTHSSSQSAANSGQLYQSWAELDTQSEHCHPTLVYLEMSCYILGTI